MHHPTPTITAHPYSAAARHKTLELPGYSIHYYTTGDPSRETLVLLHPAFADHRCFAHQVEAFSSGYFLITIDLLGHGRSRPGKSPDKIDASAGHLKEILRLEGRAKAHFVGVSMGSLVAQHFAYQWPEAVASLTVVGGYTIHKDLPEVKKAQQKEFFKWIFKAVISLDRFRRYVTTVSSSKPEEQARLYEMAQSFTWKSFSVMPGLNRIIQPRDPGPRIYPLLIVAGVSDMELVKKYFRLWHEEEPGSILEIIEDAGHCANMDNPAAFHTALKRFLENS